GLGFQGATPSQGTYNPATGVWTVGTLANGATATLTVTATVNNVRPLRNAAAADGDQFDPDPDDNTDAVIVWPQFADLGIRKSVNNAGPNVGDTVTFTLTVANRGLNTATNVVVNDLLPAGLTFVSATPSQGTYNNVTGIWTVGTLARGATATLTIQATVA